MRTLSYLFIGLVLMGLASCKKSVITQAGDPAVGVAVKFIHAAPGTPALDLYLNDAKVNPVSSISVTDNRVLTSVVTGLSYNYNGTASTYLGLFPSNNYAVVPSANTLFKVTLSTPVPALVSPQTNGVGYVVGTLTRSTTDGSAFSVFVSGLPNYPPAPLVINVVPDEFPAPAAGMAYVRLAYMIPNGTPVDLSATTTLTGSTTPTTKNVFTNIAYSNVTAFVAVPVNPTGLTNYTFQLLLSGTTTALGTVSAAISLAPGRYYTIVGRGLAADYAVPGTGITLKASARPTLPLADSTTKYPEIYFAPAQVVYYTNK